MSFIRKKPAKMVHHYFRLTIVFFERLKIIMVYGDLIQMIILISLKMSLAVNSTSYSDDLLIQIMVQHYSDLQ